MNRTSLSVACLALAALVVGCADTPLDRYGRLRVENLQLVAESGKPVQLRGVSSHNIAGSDWLFGAEQLTELVKDFQVDVVRLAMYTNPAQQGYLANPSVKKTIEKLILATEKAGVYCIVDWHILWDNDPNLYKTEAIAFFSDLAERYKDKKHLLFEICNEPNGEEVTWNERIRPYAVDVLAAIRQHDPTRLVLVGTPTWSQDVDIAAQNPLPDKQVLYVFHWYAGTHGQALRDKVDKARQTIPLFNTEWGSTDSSGRGAPFPAETLEWLTFLNERNISWVNWSFSNYAEGSAALKASFQGDKPLKEALSASGKILYDQLRNR